jgi:hypothetical protein
MCVSSEAIVEWLCGARNEGAKITTRRSHRPTQNTHFSASPEPGFDANAGRREIARIGKIILRLCNLYKIVGFLKIGGGFAHLTFSQVFAARLHSCTTG